MTSHYSKYGGDYNSMTPGGLERSHGSSASMVGSPPGRSLSGAIGGDRGDRGERLKGGPRETPFMDREYQERLGDIRDRERKDRDRDMSYQERPVAFGTGVEIGMPGTSGTPGTSGMGEEPVIL